MTPIKGKFELKLGDVPKEHIDGIPAELSAYSTSLMFGGTYFGSGTFATIDKHHGVLTATHVVKNGMEHAKRAQAFENETRPKQKKTDGEGKLKLSLKIADHPHSFSLPFSLIDPVMIGDGADKPYGPDLAFIPIPKEFVAQVSARRSFWPLTKEPETRLSEFDHCIGFVVVIGLPDERKKVQPGSHGFTQLMELNVEGHFGVVDAHRRVGEFDYLDIAVGNKNHPLVPQSYRGVSGGGVWQVVFGKKASDPEQKLIYLPPALVGVSYYEYELKDGTIALHAHGPESVYRNIVRAVRDKFPQE